MHRRQIIGVIEPDLVGAFTAAIMDGIHTIAQQSDMQVMVFKGSPASVGGRMLAQDHIDGWILCDCTPEIHYLGYPDRPVVAISMAGCADRIPTIMPDNQGAIKSVMQHLFDHGHKRVAFIGPMKNADVQQRYAAYRMALEQRGAFDPRLVIDTNGGHFEEHGRAAVQALLETELNFTAVVTAGDFNAFGAIEVLRSAGLRVPEDVAITGFDAVPRAQFFDPP
jgi:DNA-binding LacI/PurR family transcriptional regulator